MKPLSYIILLTVLNGCSVSQSQFHPVDNKEFTFSKINKNLPFSKNELYLKSNYWIVDYFLNPKEVVQYSDKQEGVIKGIYKERYSIFYQSTLPFQFTIKVKDSFAKIDVKPRQQLSVNEKGKREVIPLLKGKLMILLRSYHKKMQEE